MARITPVQLINQDRRWLLQAAYSYNHLDSCPYPDHLYDYTVKCLQKLQVQYPEEWMSSSVYPEVFLRNDDWTFTSSHFPVTPEIVEWYGSQQERAKGET